MENTKMLERALVKELASYAGMTQLNLKVVVQNAVLKYFMVVDETDNLLAELKVRVVNFQYYKADGSRREAWGTLKESFLENRILVSRGERWSNQDNITYFDVEKNDWRCFKKENIIGLL